MGPSASAEQAPPAHQPEQQAQSDPIYAPEEPAFQLEPGRPDISYYWIDRRVYSGDNQMAFNYFRNNFRMEIFTSIEGLKTTLEESKPGEIIKVLTAAGLPDEDFRYLHNEPKVSEVFLFCANEERAKLLMRNFKKITDYGLRKEKIVEIMREAEKRAPKEVVPITEELIGKRMEGGIQSTEKEQAATTSGSARVVSNSNAGNASVNVNNSLVGVCLDPVNVNVNQSSVIVNMNPPQNVNQSAVNVNMNPPVNVNQSSVVVNLEPPKPINVNQSSVVVNLEPPKPINVNNSTVNVVL